MEFYRANMKHSQVILDILGNTIVATDTLLKLKNPNFYIFISKSNKSMLSYEPVFGEVPFFLVHTYSDPEERSVDLKKFLWGTGLWMCDNAKAEGFMAVIPKRLRHYGIFLRHAGAKRQGKEGDVTIYTFGLDQYDEITEKLNKLKEK